MKLNALKVKAIDAADAATLQAAILAFVQQQNQRTFVDVRYAMSSDGALRSALILYTE